jgi:hypothetical protein
LTCGDLRLFAGHPLVRDPIAQGQILRIEIGGLRQRQRIDQTFWYAAPRHQLFHPRPGGFDAADESGVVQPRLRRHVSDGEAARQQQDASPDVLRNSQAACLIDSNWSIMGS